MKIFMLVVLTLAGSPLLPDRIDPSRFFDNENEPR
jgi:hypothetical protein